MNVQDDTGSSPSEQTVDPCTFTQDPVGNSNTLENSKAGRLYHQSGANWMRCGEALEQRDLVTLSGEQERSC